MSRWASLRANAVRVGDATRDGGLVAWAALVRFWKRVQRPGVGTPAERLEKGVMCMRPWSMAAALAVFIIGFSVDDLAVLRFPGYLAGITAAILLIAVAPTWWGWSWARTHYRMNNDDYDTMAMIIRRVGYVILLASALGAVFWFGVFSEGVPSWAAG